jgi:hypothetical protein
VVLRITYARFGELRDDVAQQMARGGLLIKIAETGDLVRDTPVRLELVLPDGVALRTQACVLQVLAGFGVAVSVDPVLVDAARHAAGGVDRAGAGAARHERIGPGAPPPPTPPEPSERAEPAKPEALSRAEKIQKALHGTRDDRNAILRDRDRTLHPFVLKNPQLNADDVVAIAKNAQMTPELLKLIGERKDWLQRPAIALALARNPKTPPELAVRALDHIPADALRQMAKGPGVLPHVSQAARKKLLG